MCGPPHSALWLYPPGLCQPPLWSSSHQHFITLQPVFLFAAALHKRSCPYSAVGELTSLSMECSRYSHTPWVYTDVLMTLDNLCKIPVHQRWLKASSYWTKPRLRWTELNEQFIRLRPYFVGFKNVLGHVYTAPIFQFHNSQFPPVHALKIYNFWFACFKKRFSFVFSKRHSCPCLWGMQYTAKALRADEWQVERQLCSLPPPQPVCSRISACMYTQTQTRKII